MGVQGLWELLTPIGRRVSVDSLGSRKLAIDASIWIIQFMKAMRDDKGDMIRNAHLLGFFRRICKLLYLRIKPVFVFDGATPALKRRTVLARRRQREQAQSRLRKTAEKLLLNHLRTRKLEEIASDLNLGSQKKYQRNDDVGNTPDVDFTYNGESGSTAQVEFSGPSTSHDKYDQVITDEMLAASLAAADAENGVTFPDGSEEESDEEEQLILPTVNKLDPSVLASLPPSMQLDLLVQMREQLVADNRQQFQKVAKVPASFSQMQIQNYLKTVAFRREINEAQKAAAGVGVGGVPTARIASAMDREFIFSKSYEGEKPAPSEFEEQNRLKQATPPKANRSSSLMKQSSALFSSFTGAQGKSAPEEDGVISLVSTELNKENDPATVVHTYIDERGNVRVNRRRGMGVRMTRDLQWNLYLMKDAQTRKSEESKVVSAEPPIIPSISRREEMLPTVSNSKSSSLVGQGLQISFLEEEVSELSKDDDGSLFEALVVEGDDSKDDQASAIHSSTLQKSTVNPASVAVNGEDVEEEEEIDWEDGDVNDNGEGSMVEDRDMAEAVRLSLVEQPLTAFQSGEKSNQTLLDDASSGGESEVEWEDGTGDVSAEGLDGARNEELNAAIEDAGIEEAIRRSLEDFRPPPKPSSGGESEVEWEDGSGDVSVEGLDGAQNEDLNEAILVHSEEAGLKEAIRLSLENFHPHPRPSSQLVIKEPTDGNSNSEPYGLKVLPESAPLGRAEAESEEVYLARERTRKGKAVLAAGKEEPLSTVVRRAFVSVSEQNQIAALTVSEMPVNEATIQSPAKRADNSLEVQEPESEEEIDFDSLEIQESECGEQIDFGSICIPKSINDHTEDLSTKHPTKLQNLEKLVEAGGRALRVDQIKPECSVAETLEIDTVCAQAVGPLEVASREKLEEMQPSEKFVEAGGSLLKVDQSKPESSVAETLEIDTLPAQAVGPLGVPSREKVEEIRPSEMQMDGTEVEASPSELLRSQEQSKLPCVSDGQEVKKSLPHPVQHGPQPDFNQEDLLRQAEEMNFATERDDEQSRKAALTAEREMLAREEADLQELLEVEQAEMLAGLDRERELLAQEEMELRSAQKKNERNADSVTSEMFTEVQELLQMFGLPYLIAPMEAEAQCAYMDIIQLVDGVVTDDSDIFLFGGASVYRNLFDDRKYVETYYMKDLESEMGMSREKLIRIAMLLGSDYTEGISGIGIVNAIEVVNAFPEDDGLQKFKEWMDSPDHSLFQKAQGHSKGKGKRSGKAEKAGVEDGLAGDGDGDGDGEGDLDQSEGGKFTIVQQTFMQKHRAVSKNWNVPESFPSEAVVTAYINPVVDKSKETFSWGRPDLEALRKFCYDRFSWNKQKADELLLPVLKEYDRRETQTRLESFYHFNQRFAKIRSRRIQKAVTGMTGKRSAEMMDLPPHLIVESPPKKSRKKSEPLKSSDAAPVNEVGAKAKTQQSKSQHDIDGAADTKSRGAGRGRKGRTQKQSEDLPPIETLEGHVDNGQDIKDTPSGRGARKRSRASGQGLGRARARARGRGRGRVSNDEEASISDSLDSDDPMKENLGEIQSLKRRGENVQPRRSTRQRSQVTTYHVDHSDEEVDATNSAEESGSTYSDGEDLFKEVDLLVAKALESKSKHAPPVLGSTDFGQTGNSSDMVDESARLDKSTGQTDFAGREISELATGGGFCPEEDELIETGEDLDKSNGQTDFAAPSEINEFATGGGFCPEDDELVETGQELDKKSDQNEFGGPSERSEFATGGGFCPEEDEPVETGEEMREQDSGFGGGFSRTEDEHDQPLDVENGTIVDQIQQSLRFGGGFCLSDDDAPVVSERERDVGREHTKTHAQNSPLAKLCIDSRQELGHPTLIPDASISENVIPEVSQSTEPKVFGLRAMPLMRRKKTKQ